MLVSLLGIGTDGEIDTTSMLYNLIPYMLPKNDDQGSFDALLQNPQMFLNMMSQPGTVMILENTVNYSIIYYSL